MSHLLAKVVKKSYEAYNVVSLELANAQAKTLPPFSAGSHIEVHVGSGMIRQYSLCNDPKEQHRYVIGVLLDPASRGASAALHERVEEGDLIQISEPMNRFPLVPAQRSILFAGGIGITPILSMAEALSRLGTPFELHYCARSESHAAFREHIANATFASNVHFHFDDGCWEQRLDAAAVLAWPDPGGEIFVCGPAGFISLITSVAVASGWDRTKVHSEFFSMQRMDISSDLPFDVKLASTGRVYRVPTGVSVTTALAAHGVCIPTSCENGVCGTCTTKILEGTPAHRDYYLTSREKAKNDRFTPCCSRAMCDSLLLDL